VELNSGSALHRLPKTNERTGRLSHLELKYRSLVENVWARRGDLLQEDRVLLPRHPHLGSTADWTGFNQPQLR
jgi:hypothetical protein